MKYEMLKWYQMKQDGMNCNTFVMGVPGGVIGNLARKAGAAPGGPNFHAAKGASKVPARKGPVDPKTLGSMKSSLNFD